MEAEGYLETCTSIVCPQCGAHAGVACFEDGRDHQARRDRWDRMVREAIEDSAGELFG